MKLEAGDIERLRFALECAGWKDDISWAENILPPADAEEFAQEAVFVICNSGMRFTVARGIYRRVMAALEAGKSASSAFGHAGKAAGIDRIWAEREVLFRRYLDAAEQGWEAALAFCESLPWVGGITKYHLAKNFGAPVAKPDVHLQRLADAHGCGAQELCERLAAATGLRVPTVDTILWRACATGLLHPPKGRA